MLRCGKNPAKAAHWVLKCGKRFFANRKNKKVYNLKGNKRKVPTKHYEIKRKFLKKIKEKSSKKVDFFKKSVIIYIVHQHRDVAQKFGKSEP